MAFYFYRQSNPGGDFIIDKARGIGIGVIIEADDCRSADRIAEGIGLYFDGRNKGIDCSCCGDRWYNASRYDELDELISARTEGEDITFFHPLGKPFVQICGEDLK